MQKSYRVMRTREGRRAPRHGAPGARHPTCESTSRTPAARLSFTVGMRGGRGSQLKTLAPQSPERLIQRAPHAAAMLLHRTWLGAVGAGVPRCDAAPRSVTLFSRNGASLSRN